MMKFYLWIFCLALCACASTPTLTRLNGSTSYSCHKLYKSAQDLSSDEQLDKVSELYSQSCFKEVITLGNYIRELRRDKFYHISAELGEIFTPEGSLTEYTLESYERVYLSLLISLSALQTEQEELALVELRRSYDEEKATLYNHGSDPVVVLLQASLWDRFDPLMARPLWKSLAEDKDIGSKISQFAQTRIEQIDEHPSMVNWKIYGIGQMSELEWYYEPFKTKSSPYNIVSKSSSVPSCSSQSEVLIPTSSWAKKIAARARYDYHPLMYTKTLFRLPVGLTYGLLGVSSGVAVGVAGCGVAGALSKNGPNDGAGQLCVASLQAAGYIIGKSANLTSYVLKPDLRHWKKLPAAIYLTQEDTSSVKKCLEPTTLATSQAVLVR